MITLTRYLPFGTIILQFIDSHIISGWEFKHHFEFFDGGNKIRLSNN